MDPISAFKAQGQEGIRVREQYLPSMTADLRQEKQERTAGRWRQQGSKKERKRLCRKRGEADINRNTIII
jgi:hypothetical protein